MGKHKNRKVDLSKVTYEVGYGKTDPDTRFKDGHTRTSGQNVKKKPKEKTLDDCLSEIVEVPQKNGSMRRTTRRELAYLNLSNQAAKGDLRALKIMMEHDRRKDAGEPDVDPVIFDDDLRKQLLADFQNERLSDDQHTDDEDDADKEAGAT